MKKIRLGNDFVFLWAIERGGVAEDFTGVSDAKITASVFGIKKDIPFTISGNIVKIEFTPILCNSTGVYNLELSYTLPDETLSDDDRKCVVDVDAFQIVQRSAHADDSSEFSVTSDMAIAFQGKSAYEVWLETNEGTEEDYIAFLKQPATEAAAIANEAAGLANEKAGEANTAAEAANTAAGLADDARLSIQEDLATKADHGYDATPKTLKEVDDSVAQLGNDVKNDTEKATADSLSELNARISALEKIVSSTLIDRIDVTKEFNVWGKTNLILYGSGASTSTPDFIGQTYIDTTGGNVYIAVGTANSGNWKLV